MPFFHKNIFLPIKDYQAKNYYLKIKFLKMLKNYHHYRHS